VFQKGLLGDWLQGSHGAVQVPRVPSKLCQNNMVCGSGGNSDSLTNSSAHYSTFVSGHGSMQQTNHCPHPWSDGPLSLPTMASSRLPETMEVFSPKNLSRFATATLNRLEVTVF